ncbi:DUF1707 domain-containing protein [Kitasatospora sp. NPDC101183]|uniref:DUF1707 SHOCT-like domain-containing protein n=1 Tax=Kitasatospora sp. NPDC101183 TaxID=3364100 RepID=UPI0037FF0D25
MTISAGDPQPIASQADRDSAVQRVQAAFADGHLTPEEMDERLDLVLAARGRGELDTVLATLPAEAPATQATIGAASGRIKRGGVWRVPRHLTVASAMGRVNLDLSRAIIEDPVIDIELQVGTGRAKITVPAGAIVELDGLVTQWKDTRYRLPRRTERTGPTIRISGVMGFGRLTVRHARR